jgi:cytochrome c peroxidase
VREGPRYPKSESAEAGNPLIAETVHIKGIEGRLAGDEQQFKIPTLWGVKDTAPYFHDNGAKTLRDAVAHYQRFFNFTEAEDPVGSQSLGGLIELTDNDVDDIVAYLQLGTGPITGS